MASACVLANLLIAVFVFCRPSIGSRLAFEWWGAGPPGSPPCLGMFANAVIYPALWCQPLGHFYEGAVPNIVLGEIPCTILHALSHSWGPFAFRQTCLARGWSRCVALSCGTYVERRLEAVRMHFACSFAARDSTEWRICCIGSCCARHAMYNYMG